MMKENKQTKMPVLYRGTVDHANPLARYHSSRAVRIVTDRILALDTQGLNKMQGAMVAQCALANHLNPFPPRPDLHYWLSEVWDPIKKCKVIKLNIMEQREATIRNAETNAKREGTYLHAPKFTHIIDDTHKEQLGFDVVDKVCHARISDHRQVKEYFDRRRELKEEGMSSEDIDKRLGIEPEYYEGYGNLNPKEQEACKKGRYSGVNKVQKRAYVEALKQKWARMIDYDEMIAGAPENDEDYVIDGEWQMAEIDDDDSSFDREESQKASEALFGNGTSTPPGAKKKDPPKPTGTDRPIPPERLKARFDTTVAAHKGTRRTDDLQQKVFLNFKDCVTASKNQDDDRHAVQMFLTGKSSLTDWSGSELLAALKWMDPHKGKNDKYHPNILSTQEFSIIATYMREEA